MDGHPQSTNYDEQLTKHMGIKMKHTSILILVGSLFFAATPNAGAKENSEPKLPIPIINGESGIPLKSVNVLGSAMSYLEAGTGETILFV